MPQKENLTTDENKKEAIAEQILISPKEVIAQQRRARTYSQLSRRQDSFESIDVNGTTYVIPATVGTIYWAILHFMYQNINQPVLFEELTEGVDEVMKEHDEDALSAKQNKREASS